MYNSHLLKIAIIVHVFTTSVIAQESLIGQAAPELGIEKFLQAPEGEKSLSALKGNVVVLEFWATWCAPCIAAIPHLNQLNEEFRDKPVRFISVTREGEDVVAPFLKKKEMKSWIGLDTDRSVFKAYGIRRIPRTFVIDQKGTIAASFHPTELSSDLLEKALRGKKVEIELPELPKPTELISNFAGTEKLDMRNVHWGMTVEELKKAEDWKLLPGRRGTITGPYGSFKSLRYAGTLSGLNIDLSYKFYRDEVGTYRLRSASYSIREDPDKKAFQRFKDEFNLKYGAGRPYSRNPSNHLSWKQTEDTRLSLIWKDDRTSVLLSSPTR